MKPPPSSGRSRDSSPTEPTPTCDYVDKPAPIKPAPVAGQRRLGRFELRAVLGQGAFGTVYRAYDPQLDREVALKVPRLPPNRPDLVERFLREARSAARLRHPGIVAVFEAGSIDGEQFIVSELVTGQSLRERADRGGRPTIRQAAAWVRDLALALEYAHGQGIIHRDIKPANIMIDAHNRAQLADFGLAKRLNLGGPIPLAEEVLQPRVPLVVTDPQATAEDEGSQREGSGASGANTAPNSPTYALLTAEGAVLGTPAYMSPEQASGVPNAVGPYSDQYSLGVVLYELLTGQQPFKGNIRDLLRQLADPACKATPPRTLNPEVPLPLAAVCLKAMAKDPAQRYDSAADFAVDLQRWLNGQRVRAYRGPRRRGGRIRRMLEWFQGHRTAMLATLVGLGLFGLLLISLSSYILLLHHRVTATREELARTLQQAAADRQFADDAHRLVDDARRATNTARCDLFRERGRLARGGQALRFFAESLALAIEMEDVRRQQAVMEFLDQGNRSLPRPPDVDRAASLQWDLAAHLLLARPLPEDGAWQLLGERLPRAGNAEDTGFASGGQRVLTADNAIGLGDPLPYRDARTGEAFGDRVPTDERVLFSPDGRRALRVGPAWNVWDLNSGNLLAPRYDWQLTHWGFSADGTKLAIRWTGPLSGAVLVQIWDTASVRPLTRPIEIAFPKMSRDTVSVALSNDGSKVAMIHPGVVGVWPILDEDRAGAGAVVQDLTGTPEEWKARAGRPPGRDESQIGRRPKKLIGGDISAAVFLPDGGHLLFAGADQVKLWDMAGKSVIDFLPVTGARQLVLSPQGEQVLIQIRNGWQLWDLALRRRMGLPLERLANVQRMAFRGDGRQLLAAANGDAHLWPNPVVAKADRPAALRQWAQAATGFDVNANGELEPLEPEQRQGCLRRFAKLAGLVP